MCPLTSLLVNNVLGIVVFTIGLEDVSLDLRLKNWKRDVKLFSDDMIIWLENPC